jgi:hypothetical protein
MVGSAVSRCAFPRQLLHEFVDAHLSSPTGQKFTHLHDEQSRNQFPRLAMIDAVRSITVYPDRYRIGISWASALASVVALTL